MAKCADKKKLKTYNKETTTVNFEVFKEKKILFQNVNLELGVFAYVCEQGEVGTFSLFSKTRKFGYMGLIQPTMIDIVSYHFNHSEEWNKWRTNPLSLEKIIHMGKKRKYKIDWDDLWLANDPCYSILIATDRGDIFEIMNNPESGTFEQSNRFNFSSPILAIKVNHEQYKVFFMIGDG